MMNRPQSNTEGEAAASRHEKANRSWKLVLLVLSALLAAALIVIYRLAFANVMINQTLQTLKEENEALRKNLSDEKRLKCEAGWEPHGEKCYYFTTTKSSWKDSRDGCKLKGGDLVKIDSREEQEFLEARLREKMEEAQDKFWIGLTDSEEEGRWLWVDGSSLDTRLNFWNSNEPDNWTGENPDGEDCVRMGEKGGSADLKCWFDRVCSDPYKSICEKAAETR
ncbi:hepatic lectin-like isoform X2 [Melanotaenia boesemani]|uniref:hepatic lectin-like isoform X2 n=1 Tax=Melanotaenia boesemani TaxID=1250792 RepID=UPI001C0579EE|nr:hepatic lectin-like isoform X2 [Melanotaenia boesemani]